MLSSIFKKPNFFNHHLHDLCLKSSNESIKKIVARYNDERKYKNLIISEDSGSNNPNKKIIPFIFCLSISLFIFIFITQKKKNMFSYDRYI